LFSIVTIDESIFLNASNRNSIFLFAVLTNDTFVGNNVVNAFANCFFDLLLVSAAIGRSSVRHGFVFAKNTHVLIIGNGEGL